MIVKKIRLNSFDAILKFRFAKSFAPTTDPPIPKHNAMPTKTLKIGMIMLILAREVAPT